MARPSDYRAGYRKNTRNRQKKENKFYTKVNNGGILNKRLPDIDEIKQNIEAEKRKAQEYENEWLDSVVNNADERQTNAAKARAQEAKSSIKDWNEKLSEAYGLGENGYWNSTQQPNTQQSQQMRANPEHAYAAGNGSQTRTSAAGNNTRTAASQGKRGRYDRQPKTTTVPSAAGSVKNREIMDLQDTLVNDQGMSAREKNQIQDKINGLTAEKNVLDWKDANSGRPTQENYQTQIDYYNRLITQAQDNMVNALGGGNVSVGDDAWYEYQDKVDELVTQRDAYNRGMMGQLDGEKAQTAEEATATAGGGRSANDQTVSKPAMDDERKEDGVKPYPWSQDENSNNTTAPYASLTDEKDAEKQAAITELDDQMEEEIAAASNLRQDTYNRAYEYFDENIDVKGMRQSMIGQISSSLGIDASGFSDEELKEAFAQSTWVLDDAYDVSVDDIVEDIKEKYAELKDEALGEIDYKYDALERIGELDENPEVSLINWTNDSVDLLSQWQEELTAEEIDIILKSDYDDLTPVQFIMRAEYDSQKIINEANSQIEEQLPFLEQLEQMTINDGLTYFNEALEKWKEGDDFDIRNLVLDMYDGEKQLEDIEDFNSLRNEYVQNVWEGYEKEFLSPIIDERDQALAETEKAIDTQFKEIINFEENENGYSFELPPELIDYAINLAEKREVDYQTGKNAVSGAGMLTGFVVGMALSSIPILGPFLGGLIGLYIAEGADKGSDILLEKADIWDDVAIKLEYYIGTDKTLLIKKEGTDVDIIEKE